jgi:hypothetical protein
MIVTQHYLYYVNADGHGMILVGYETQANGQNVYEWISHLYISDYTPPLLLTLEKVRGLLEQDDWSALSVQIGDWVSIKRCQQNLHRVT